MREFKPITQKGLGVEPVQFSPEKEALLTTIMEVEKERYLIAALEEWSTTGNRAKRRKCKKLLAEHQNRAFWFTRESRRVERESHFLLK